MPLNEISDDSTSISSEELRAVRYRKRRTLKLSLGVAFYVAANGALSVSQFFIGSLHSLASIQLLSVPGN
jgi:hypothetical protein